MNKRSQEIATVHTEANDGKTKKKKLTTTQRITYLATLVAASLVFKMLGNMLTFGTFRFSIVYIPWIISAIVLGPIGGLTVCFATDVIGTLIVPTGGAPVPLLIVSNALFGFSVGCAFKLPKLDDRLKLAISAVAAIVICTMGLSTYALAKLYYQPFFAQWVTRLPQALVAGINFAVVGFLFPLLRKIGLMQDSKA